MYATRINARLAGMVLGQSLVSKLLAALIADKRLGLHALDAAIAGLKRGNVCLDLAVLGLIGLHVLEALVLVLFEPFQGALDCG